MTFYGFIIKIIKILLTENHYAQVVFVSLKLYIQKIAVEGIDSVLLHDITCPLEFVSHNSLTPRFIFISVFV